MRRLLVILPLLLAVSGCGSLSSIVGVGESATSLNSFRAANGLSQLSSDPGLTAMAQSHAADMARRESLDHNGFMEFRGPKGARAENVAYGLRIIDISNPHALKEVAYYMPDVPPGSDRVQSNDVTVDDRGLIYLLDRVRGLHILERT